jgi:hypothetical protein
MNLITLDALVETYTLWASACQRLGVDAQGRPLDDDGRIGPLSRGGRYLDPTSVTCPAVRAAVSAAIAGGREVGGNDRGQWPRALMTTRAGRGSIDPQATRDAVAVEPQQGQWCAGGLSWLLWVAYGEAAPHSWSARQLGEHVAAWGQDLGTDAAKIEPGDVIVWQRRSEPGGHVAICAAHDDERIYCLEANTSRRQSAIGLIAYSRASGVARGQQELHQIARLPQWARTRRAP